jgi:cytochrome c
MKTIFSMLVITLIAVAGYKQLATKEVKEAPKNDMPLLAKSAGCANCHAIDSKLVGPAWRDISNKYRNKKDFIFAGDTYSLEDGLVHKVSLGGNGHWGDQVMASNDAEGKNQEDIRALVRLVLALPQK